MKTKTELKLEAANLRVLAASQDETAAVYRQQAAHPIYPGQDAICMGKAAQVDALAARNRALADHLDSQAVEN